MDRELTVDYAARWNDRLRPVSPGFFDVRSKLRHFALINYALPKPRLEPHVDTDRFAIAEFPIDGTPMAIVSAVPFLDVDFHSCIIPAPKFQFGQTNFRAYIIDKSTGEHCVWFFGTTLGSPIVQLPRAIWRIPWHQARYDIDCIHNSGAKRYDHYRYKIDCDWCRADIDIEDTGEPVALTPGFATLVEMEFILTHPLVGYFYRLDGRLGAYGVWHKKIVSTQGRAGKLYFSLFERLGLLTAGEMMSPHSIFICPETDFLIRLPPHALR